MTEVDWLAIERSNHATTLRHAIAAETSGRSIAAFYSRKEQRRFIADNKLIRGDP